MSARISVLVGVVLHFAGAARVPKCQPEQARQDAGSKGLRTGNCALLARKVRYLLLGQVRIQHAVQSPRFVLVAIHAVLDVLRGVAREVVFSLPSAIHPLSLFASRPSLLRSTSSCVLHHQKRALTSLSLHRTNPRILKEQPVVHLIPLSRSLGIANLVLRIIPLDKVLHDAAALKQTDGIAIGEFVCQRGDAAIGVDLQEPRLFLRVL
jgi:hypothetical protein